MIIILAKYPADRLKIIRQSYFFQADGKSRGKIGIPPLRATGIMGSYDSDNKILTLLICRLPEEKQTMSTHHGRFRRILIQVMHLIHTMTVLWKTGHRWVHFMNLRPPLLQLILSQEKVSVIFSLPFI